jgi:hypothetical protein
MCRSVFGLLGLLIGLKKFHQIDVRIGGNVPVLGQKARDWRVVSGTIEGKVPLSSQPSGANCIVRLGRAHFAALALPTAALHRLLHFALNFVGPSGIRAIVADAAQSEAAAPVRVEDDLCRAGGRPFAALRAQ